MNRGRPKSGAAARPNDLGPWLLALACFTACGDGSVPRLAAPPPSVFWLRAGASLELIYDREIDESPVGQRWRGGALGGSPLAHLDLPPVLFKADDFGSALAPGQARYLDILQDRGAISTLGVITDRLDENDTSGLLKDLDAAEHELWFHGHTHDWSLPEAEFSGVPVGRQVDALRRGLSRARALLALDFSAFGAPGNEIDVQTADALAEFPQLTVWFNGYPGHGPLLLQRTVEAETKPGDIRDPEQILAESAAYATPSASVPAVVMQVHPHGWNDDELVLLERLLDGLRHQGFWFASARGVQRRLAERSCYVLEKVSPTSYRLDGEACRFDHRLEILPTAPLPFIGPAAPLTSAAPSHR